MKIQDKPYVFFDQNVMNKMVKKRYKTFQDKGFQTLKISNYQTKSHFYNC